MTELETYNSIINAGDSFQVGDEYLLYVNEIFEIDGCVYLATSTNKDVITIDGVSVNRNIVPAELFVKRNSHLFEN